jgi:hypothetical protein
MGQVLHGSATTTEARRYGINQKTVAKWKWRRSVADLPTGPKDPCSGSRLSRAVSGAVVGRSRRSGRSGDRRREPGIWSSTERDYSEARDHVWPAIRLASAANPACGRTASASGGEVCTSGCRCCRAGVSGGTAGEPVEQTTNACAGDRCASCKRANRDPSAGRSIGSGGRPGR